MDVGAPRPIFAATSAAGIADLDHAGVHADPELEIGAQHARPVGTYLRERFDHSQRSTAGQFGVVGLVGWSVPHRAEAVTVVVDYQTVVFHDRRGEAVHDLAQELARQPDVEQRGQLGETAEI